MAKKKIAVAVQSRPQPRPVPTPAAEPRKALSALPLDIEDVGEEHRQFPRAKIAVPFNIWMGEGDDRTFNASLRSSNISVSGAFLESTFFLPVNSEVSVSFALEQDGEPVRARAIVIREERPRGDGGGRSGMGIRFLQFFGQSEVTLARLFLGDVLRDFAGEYLRSDRARALSSELERVVDALAAWELLKVTAESPSDPWRSAGKTSNLSSLRPDRSGPTHERAPAPSQARPAKKKR